MSLTQLIAAESDAEIYRACLTLSGDKIKKRHLEFEKFSDTDLNRRYSVKCLFAA